MEFTWNIEKAAKVKQVHSIYFEKIKDVFDDPYAIEFIDDEHSTEEEIRFEIIGLTAEYGLIHLVFIEITETHLHFITARKAENWMIKEYEQNRSRI